MTMTLGEKIKKYRQARGLSQEQLSEKLSVQDKQLRSGSLIKEYRIFIICRQSQNYLM